MRGSGGQLPATTGGHAPMPPPRLRHCADQSRFLFEFVYANSCYMTVKHVAC